MPSWLPALSGIPEKPDKLIFGNMVRYDHETILKCDRNGIKAIEAGKNESCRCGRKVDGNDFVFIKGSTCAHYEEDK